jgi:pimeloyl-ACP methyl ester carboxylesterase
MSQAVQWVDLALPHGHARIEFQWVGLADATGPVIVFLHEGLGSLAMWKDFPDRLCKRLACKGLVYSRPGYGGSPAMQPTLPWGPDFMHRQAHDTLPALLAALQVQEPIVLLGHSDGASIALLYAASRPQSCKAVIALAPHLFVEAKTLLAIAALQDPRVRQPLLARLSKYHQDPHSALERWSQAWLAPDFVAWSITDTITALQCPVLAVQGSQDEYGSLVHLQTLAQHHAATEQLVIEACGHAPHRDQAELLSAAIVEFFKHL